MVLPPLFGGDQESEMEPAPAVAVTAPGALGGPVGVTAFDGADGALVPAEFVAVTVNVYVDPLTRPLTVALVGAGAPDTVTGVCGAVPMNGVTVYDVIVAPFEAPAVQVTTADPVPATALTFVGAPGGEAGAGVTALDGVDAALVPMALTAATVKVYVVPLESPLTVAVVGGGDPLRMRACCAVDPMNGVMTYAVIALPPFAGAVHVTVAA